MYLVNLALRPWKLAPWSQVLSATAVGILLLLVALLYWLQQGLSPIIDRLQGEQVVTAFLDAQIEDDSRVLESVRSVVSRDADAKLVSSGEFLRQLRAKYADLAHELEGLGAETRSIVPRYISITGNLSESDLERIKSVPGIESMESSKDRNRGIVSAYQALRWAAGLLAGGLCFALFTGLLHLSRSNAQLHRDAVQLLKLWGASEWVMRAPAVLSLTLCGILGGALGAGAWLSAGKWFAGNLKVLSPALGSLPPITLQMALAILLGGMLLGLLAGALASTARQESRA